MEELCGVTPIETLGVRDKEIKDDSYKAKVAEFVKKSIKLKKKCFSVAWTK